MTETLTEALVRTQGPAATAGTLCGRALADAYAAHPERFVRKPTEPPRLPEAAWINCPTQEVA